MLRVLPSLTDLIFLAPFGFALAARPGGMSSLLEGDTGWHIRTGEWILQNGRVPDKDIFSYTMAGQPWFAWEWLWDIGAALLHRYGGLAAVILATLIVIGLTMVLVFRMARARSNNDLIAFAVTALAVGASNVHWLARPHVVGWLFFLVFYLLLEKAQGEAKPGLLWWLPAITVLWTNIHGSFFLGIFLIGIYAAGELCCGLLRSDVGGLRNAERRARPYWIAALACLAASFANPYSYHLHAHVIEFLRDPYYLNTISEYLPTALRGGLQWFLEPLVFLAMAAAAWNASKGRFTHTFLLVVWAHLGLSVIRNVPMFVMIAAPLIAEMLSACVSMLKDLPTAPWLRRLRAEFHEVSQEVSTLDRPWRLHLASLAAVVLIGIVMYAPSHPKRLDAAYNAEFYPEAALPVLRSEPQDARIFTDDEWGDFLIYRLYPDRKVFVDGRADMYGSKFGQSYIETMHVSHDWEARLARYGVDTVLLSTRSALASALKESRRWRVVYDDHLAIVFRKLSSNPVFEQGNLEEICGTVAAEDNNRGNKPLQHN